MPTADAGPTERGVPRWICPRQRFPFNAVDLSGWLHPELGRASVLGWELGNHSVQEVADLRSKCRGEAIPFGENAAVGLQFALCEVVSHHHGGHLGYNCFPHSPQKATFCGFL